MCQCACVQFMHLTELCMLPGGTPALGNALLKVAESFQDGAFASVRGWSAAELEVPCTWYGEALRRHSSHSSLNHPHLHCCPVQRISSSCHPCWRTDVGAVCTRALPRRL